MADTFSMGLDLGSTVGYSIARNDVIETGGIVKLHREGAHPGERYANFLEWLKEVAVDVDEIFFEVVNQNSKWATSTEVWTKLFGMLELFAYYHRIYITGYHLSHLKAQFIPKHIMKGYKGDKDAAKLAVCHHCVDLGWPRGEKGTTRYHDEADANMALIVGRRKMGKNPVFGNYQ